MSDHPTYSPLLNIYVQDPEKRVFFPSLEKCIDFYPVLGLSFPIIQTQSLSGVALQSLHVFLRIYISATMCVFSQNMRVSEINLPKLKQFMTKIASLCKL